MQNACVQTALQLRAAHPSTGPNRLWCSPVDDALGVEILDGKDDLAKNGAGVRFAVMALQRGQRRGQPNAHVRAMNVL